MKPKFKVCSVQPCGHFGSVLRAINNKDGGILYFLDEWVGRRKGYGPLAVFNTFSDAKAFSCCNDKIFVCRCKRWWGRRFLWNNQVHTNPALNRFSSFPPGTYLVRKVKLIKEV